MLDIMDKDMLELFFEDTSDMLETCIDKVLEANDRFDDEIIEEIMRTMHSIKGASSMIDLYCLESFAHRLEDMFIDMKNNKVDFEEEFIDIIVESISLLKKRLDIRKDLFLKKHFEFNKDLEDEKEELDNMLKKIENNFGKQDKYDEEELIQTNYADEKNKIYEIDIFFDKKAEMFELKKIMVKNNLEEIGTILQSNPNDEELLTDNSEKYCLEYQSEETIEEIMEKIEVGDIFFVFLGVKGKNQNIQQDIYLKRELNYQNIQDIFEYFKNNIKGKNLKNVIVKNEKTDIYGIQFLLLLNKMGINSTKFISKEGK